MRWYKVMRQQKLLSLSLLLVTLAIGIVIGTLLNTGVHAAKGQAAAPDATPAGGAKPGAARQRVHQARQEAGAVGGLHHRRLHPKAAEKTRTNAASRKTQATANDDGSDLLRRFFRNGPSAAILRRGPSARNSPGPVSSSTRTDTSSPTIM